MNSNTTSRDSAIRNYIKSLQRRDTERARLNFAVKGRDTYLDGYSEPQFKQLCIALWKASNDGGNSGCYLRTLVDQLLGHFLLARGQDRRDAELSDIHTFDFNEEGTSPCFPVFLTTRQSKANQHGRTEMMGAFQNVDPVICPMGALGFYFLHRWDLTEEPFPDFSKRSLWYGIRLLLSSRGNASTFATRGNVSTIATHNPLAYNTQREWVGKGYDLIELHSSKKTHLPREVAARIAEINGVLPDQIARAGRWTRDQMEGCYLTNLLLVFMAGHPAQ
jgi:hypothetical protein